MRRDLMLAFVAIVVAVVATARTADACCLGCPCTKYKREDMGPILVQDPAFGYAHSARGAVPGFSIAGITRFLTTGIWKPLPRPKPPKGVVEPAPEIERGDRQVFHVAPTDVRFVMADKAGEPSKLAALEVLVRRIEKHGKVILVELDDRVFRLAACPGKPGFACLLDPGALTLRPIPPPGAVDPGQGFAKPPAP